MAILSGYTFSKLTSFVVPINKQEMSKEFFCQNIFDNAFLYSIFNKADLRKLYVTAYTLKNDFKIEVLQYVEEQEDNYTWVFQEGGKLKYHLFYDCEGLKSKLEDFRIPFDYNNLLNGKVLVKKYREWFKINNFRELYSLNPLAMDIIVERYNTDFAPKHHLPKALIDDFSHIEFKHKKAIGFVEKEFKQSEFHIALNELLTHRFYLCCCTEKIFLSKFDFLHDKNDSEIYEYLKNNFEPAFFKNYSFNNIREFLSQHYKLRRECRDLIMTYIKWRYNLPEKQFSNVALEDFNLRCCILCKNKPVLVSQV